ncbi:MAG: nucleotidyltransferase substrate binding protein [Candidatus Saganbacteria bacterium]|nr:nucleotidyltransferase substrate binding protein [Candidatus Saganbacteria bacterium]
MKEKLENYCKALKKLGEALKLTPTEINRDATIQRFEFTYELAWTTMKTFLFKLGIECLNPRDCIKAAFKQRYIKENSEEIWLDMIKDRNLSSHVYDEETSKKIYGRIKNRYLKEFKALRKEFEAKM